MFANLKGEGRTRRDDIAISHFFAAALCKRLSLVDMKHETPRQNSHSGPKTPQKSKVMTGGEPQTLFLQVNLQKPAVESTRQINGLTMKPTTWEKVVTNTIATHP